LIPKGLRANGSDLLFSLLAGAAFFLLLRATPDIPGGDDAYRHVKFAYRLVRDPHDALSQPWKLLYFWPKPVDAWFGYHLLLAPLTLVFGLITSAKVLAAAVYGAQTFIQLAILKQAGVFYRKAWVMLAIAGSGMALWRATLSRPFLFSIVLVLAAAYFTMRAKPAAVAAVSAVHALSYSMFFMVGFAPFMDLVLRRNKASLRIVAASVAGMMAGLVCNPTVPENLRFDVAQVLAPLTFGSRLIMEHLPLSRDIVNPARPLLAVWLLALLRSAWLWRKQKFSSLSHGSRMLLAMSVVCLAASLEIGRVFDYFIPLAALSAACVLTPWILESRRNRMDAAAAATVLAILCGGNLVRVYQAVRETPAASRFQGVSNYLLAHGGGSIVFNTQWEQYPFLFFWNSQNRYIVGIDPSFFLRQDPRRYWLWRHIANEDPSVCGAPHCEAGDSKDIGAVVADDFGARFVVMELDKNPGLDQVLRNHPGFREVYRDRACALFERANIRGSHA
jgi:hypothetical protein